MKTATGDQVVTRHGVTWTGDAEGIRHMLGVIDADPDGLEIGDEVYGRLEGLVVSPEQEDGWAVVWFLDVTELGQTHWTAKGWESESGHPTSLGEVGAEVTAVATEMAASRLLARYNLTGDTHDMCRLFGDLGCCLADLI